MMGLFSDVIVAATIVLQVFKTHALFHSQNVDGGVGEDDGFYDNGDFQVYTPETRALA